MKCFLVAGIFVQAAEADTCTGAACAESATMLQVGGRERSVRSSGSSIGSHRKSQVSRLFDSAVQLLREGATPEVVSFSEESLKAIEGPVKQAILEAHQSDVQRLDDLFPEFQKVLDNYKTYKNEVVSKREANTQLSNSHKTCRNDQATLCHRHDECREEETRRWGVYKAKASAFQTVLTTDTEVCTNATKDVTKDEDGIKVFQDNLAEIARAGQTTVTKWQEHRDKLVECNGIEDEHREKRTSCDAKQRELEQAICANHRLHELSSKEAMDEWSLVSQSWASLTTAVKEEEKLRKNEFAAVHEVECLLENIHERGGQPCSDKKDADGHDEADKVISHCRDATVDLGNWTIHLAEPPAAPAILADRHFPCTEAFRQEHYGSLEGACHEILECQACDAAQATEHAAAEDTGVEDTEVEE